MLPQKRLRFVFDLSQSMSRGNSWDRRLDRMAQVATLVMESLSSYDHKFHYSLYGQSGSSACLLLWDPELSQAKVDSGIPGVFRAPTTAERALVVQNMYSHSQSCASGDNTVQASLLAVREVVTPSVLQGQWSLLPGQRAEAPADDYFVFVISDANLGRYGTDPKELAAALTQDPRVHGYVMFLAEPSAAEWMAKELPLGRGVVCLETERLPTVFKDMFASAAAASGPSSY